MKTLLVFPARALAVLVFVVVAQLSFAQAQTQIGAFYLGNDGLYVRLNSLTVTETTATYRYDISYTLENRTADKAIDEGSFQAYFRNTSRGTPQYGFFGRLFPGNSLTRTYRWEELKSAPFSIIAYHSDQFFAQSPPAGAVQWLVTIPGLPALPAPTISAQPTSQAVGVGGTVSLSVAASGIGSFTYQWRKNGISINGATNATLTLSSAQSSDAGSYTVVVTGLTGSVTSAVATLTVTTGVSPLITSQPASQTVTVGGNAGFSVVASGTAPLSYQWLKNGTAIPTATNAALTLTAAQSGDAGSYSVVISNTTGSVTSNSATLTISALIIAPSITLQPASGSVAVGGRTTFAVIATGTGPLNYQWRKNGIILSGATSAELTLSLVQIGDLGFYTVAVSNSAGSITSNIAYLNVTSVTIPNPGRLINLSVLTDIATAGDDFTLGYVVGGNSTSGAKPLVIRAAGPSLGAFGVPGTLDDPKLELFARSTKTSENDNWGGSPQLTAALAAVGAFAYTGPASKDAATTASITTRDNSVRVSAAGSGTGAVIAEIYDATPAASFTTATPRLINVSVRKHLGSGLTMGFVVGGATPAKVLVRGIGPTLGAFGVPGTVVDPQLTLFNSSSVKIGENNDWAGTAELTAAFANVGAFALPATSKDAALLVTLAPGNYTAQVAGVNGTTGVALVEVYEVP
jgi:hypothetical protein